MAAIETSLLMLLRQFGYLALFFIIFAESGLFFGFFFPGDSLLFTAGLLASQGYFDIAVVLFGVCLAAILGDSVGYWSGKKFGPRFFSKPGDFFRDPQHIQEAQAFYKKHGKLSIVLARFVPVVRTFAPIAAGIGKMEYSVFLKFNIIGGIGWGVLFTGFGYILGTTLPDAENYLLPIVIVIIVISLLPMAWSLGKNRMAVRARAH